MALDLASLESKATEALNVPEPTPPPAQEATPPAPSVPPESPFDGIELEVAKGKTERFTRDQILDFYRGNMRTQDYTKKTQELAELRKQLEPVIPQYQQLMTEREQVKQFLADKKALQQYMQEAFPAETDPNDVATVGQVNDQVTRHIQMLEQKLAAMEQSLTSRTGQEVVQARQAIMEDLETAKLSDQINGHLGKLFQELPLLSAVEGSEELLRYKVFQAQPQTLEEAITLFTVEAKKQEEKIAKKFEELQKSRLTDKAQLSDGIEPPGGSTPVPQAQNFKDNRGKVNMKAVESAAVEYASKLAGD